MRGWGALLLIVLLSIVSGTESAKCRGRYYEVRAGNDGFIPRRGCRGLDTLIPEDYWTTVGYDGQLRDGRSTADFMTFPSEENNGHRQSNSYIGYWITRSKYGENRHYEAFGHVQVKPDGRVCGWFVGLNHEAVEVCGGFRVLSRNRRNPTEPIPFEWVQGQHLRNRDTLGFHHHRIAKYAQNSDEIFFGDAQVKGKTFQGIAPENERFVEITAPSDFYSKVWLLKKKSLSLAPQDVPRAQPIAPQEQRRTQDVDIYSDPHYEARIAHMRRYPYYDQYGRLSGDSSNAARPAYDAYGRRIEFQSLPLNPNLNDPTMNNDVGGFGEVEGAGAQPVWPEDQENLIHDEHEKACDDKDDDNDEKGAGKAPVTTLNSASRTPYALNSEAPVSPGQPGYSDWLRRQYAARGQIPIGGDPRYEDFYKNYKPNQPSSSSAYIPDQAADLNQNAPPSYQISQTSGGGARLVNYEQPDVNGRRPGEPGYQRPKFYVDPRSGEVVQQAYNIGNGAAIQPAQRIGDGVGVKEVQPGQVDYRSDNIGTGAQPGQITGSERSGFEPSNQNIGQGVQPGVNQIGSGAQPEYDQSQQYGNIGSGAQPGSDIYIPRNDAIPKSGPVWRNEATSDDAYRNVDVYGRPLAANGGQYKMARFRPRTIVRDTEGNVYEQRVENGRIYFYSDPHSGGEQKRIEISDLEPKIAEELEGRRRQEENLRQLIETNRRGGSNQPVRAVKKARRSSSRRHQNNSF